MNGLDEFQLRNEVTDLTLAVSAKHQQSVRRQKSKATMSGEAIGRHLLISQPNWSMNEGADP